MSHEDYLVYKGDMVDNAGYALAVALLRRNDEGEDESILPWDMSVIAEIVEAAEDILSAKGLQPCRPYNVDDNTPCYLAGECPNSKCPFKEVR